MTAPAGFNSTIHPEQRIRVCAFLMANEEVAFAVLREELGLSESSLSKQLKVLAWAGYVRLAKEKGVPRPRTWVALTPEGRQVTNDHLAALHDIAEAVTAPAKPAR